MNVQLRQMSANDADAIIEVHKISIYGLCKDFYSEEQMKAWTSILNHEVFNEGIKNPSNIGIVAILDDNIIGYGYFNLNDKEVKGIFLIPEMIGKGVGRMILSKLESIAKQHNLKELILNSTLNAEDFYKKCGYIKVRDDFAELNENCKIPCIVMTKKL